MGRIITQHAETPIILRYGQPLILTMAHGSSLGSLSPFSLFLRLSKGTSEFLARTSKPSC